MATPNSFTCITCRVSFIDAELQRGHYKTDWHRYNLKRKVAELPPVTADNFKDRVLSQQASSQDESKPQYCTSCRKSFSSENAYASHLRSRKHKEIARRADREQPLLVVKPLVDSTSAAVDPEPEPKPLVDSTSAAVDPEPEPEPLEITECLFCPHESKELENNLIHMSVKHGFFIPDLKYLVDVKGLISYLCEKVGVGYMCVWCNTKGKAFHCVEAVQQHMVDKSHCKLFFEDEVALEYSEYYDYSSSYPDGGQDDSSLQTSDQLELVLPSGIKVGHRSLKHTYKQHLPTFEQRKATLIGRMMSQYRAIGWKDGSVTMATRARDVTWALKMKQASETKLSVKANKFQPHFRPQVVF